MAEKLTAAQRRYIENALLIAALGLIFKQLTENYKSKKLGEIAETTSGGTPLRNISTYYDGDIPWIKSGELNDGIILEAEEFITQEGLENSSAKIYPKGTLVVALYGATVGKTGILGLDAASNQAVCAVFPKEDIVTTEFLFWFLRYKRPEFLGSSFGGAQPNISQKLLRDTELPIPPKGLQQLICNFMKVVEQRQNGDKSVNYPTLPDDFAKTCRIVARIEALAARVAEAQSLRREASEEAKYYKASLLNAAFAGKLIPNEAELDKNFETGSTLLEKILAERKELTKSGKDEVPPLPNPELLPELPDGWIWVTIEHICSRVTDGFHNTPKPTETGFPYVLATHVKSEGIDFDNCFYVSEADHAELYAKTHVKRGDILVVNIGAGSGTPVIVNVDFEFSFKNVAILKRLSQIDEKYMFFYLLSKRAELFKEITKGGAQPFLSLKSLRTIPFPLAPLSEQKRIVDHLETLFAQSDKVSQLQTETQKELDALMPSILDQAFKGEL